MYIVFKDEMFEAFSYYLIYVDANHCLTHGFFVGNATEFLSGPIYDLNQIGQVVAGTYYLQYIIIFYNGYRYIQYIALSLHHT